MTFDTNKIKVGIILILATFVAVYLGISAATAQLETVAWVAGVGSLVVCIGMGRRIWLIIPILSSLGLRLPLPGTISTMVLAQMAVITFLGILFLMRKLPMHLRLTELEWWCIFFLLCVLQVYMRNPVGLNVFGGGSIGGRPYIEFALTFVTAAVLSKLRVAPKEFIWWVRLTLIGSIVNFCTGVLATAFPRIGFLFGASFGAGMLSENRTAVADPEAASRIAYVRGISSSLSLWISSRMSPLKACFHPVWAPLVVFTLVAAAASGYRSQIAAVGLTYFVGLCYRGGLTHIIFSSIAGALFVSLLATVNLFNPLPPNIQRSLTFLPGTWEQRYKDDTKGSNDWRTEIWIEALTSEKYIRNKIIGDGLGMTLDQLQKSVALAESKTTGIGGWDSHRESILISGDYHSGPIQTIRTVGYFGLIVLLVGMIRVAVHAHHQILRCRGTEWYSTALFIGIPIISGPLIWVFIFGSFDGGAATLLMGTAMVRMLENNLPLPAYVARRKEAFLLKTQTMQPSQSS